MTQTLSKPNTNSKPAHVSKPAEPGAPPLLRVGLLGCGTVGQGLCTLLAEKGDDLAARHDVRFAVTHALVRYKKRSRDVFPPGAEIVDRTEDFLTGDFDLVVECMGGIEPAGTLITTFLERGVPVVTANKALLSERGGDLLALAARHGTGLRFEASVAAGIPILGLVERALQSFSVRRVSAILNGTSNYLVTRLAAGEGPLSKLLEEAKALGYAEADPSLDLSGMDAAQKLTVLARTLGSRLETDPLKGCGLKAGFLKGCGLEISDLEVKGIEGLGPEDCMRAKAFGYALKPVAVADLGTPGLSVCKESPEPVSAADQSTADQSAVDQTAAGSDGTDACGFVGPALVPANHPLAGVSGVNNGVFMEGEPLGSLFLSGPGAGALPTAASLLDDMLVVARCRRRTPSSHFTAPAAGIATSETHDRPTACDPASVQRTQPRASEPASVPPVLSGRWFLSLVPSGSGVELEDLLELVSATGLLFRELREIPDGGNIALAGITARTTSRRIGKLGARLRAAHAVKIFKAFRVLEGSEKGGHR